MRPNSENMMAVHASERWMYYGRGLDKWFAHATRAYAIRPYRGSELRCWHITLLSL
jgi:hypothetical protein